MNDALATMRRKMINLTGAVIVAVGDNGRPEGETYALLMNVCDVALFADVIELAAVSGLLVQSGHFLKLTNKGKALLTDLRATVTG